MGGKQIIISGLAMIALALAATAANASEATISVRRARMETTNVTESAPLNLVSRTFARIHPFLDATLDLQRLTYRAHAAAPAAKTAAADDSSGEPSDETTVDLAALRQLLLDISGDEDTVVKSLELAVTENQQRSALGSVTPFMPMVASLPDSEAAKIAEENLAGALKAALTREDVKVYSAETESPTETARVFFLVDEETNDILVLVVSTAKAKHGETTPAAPIRG